MPGRRRGGRRRRSPTPQVNEDVEEEVVVNVEQPFPEEEEDDGEDLFGENFEADYAPQPHLDVYDPHVLADDDEDLEEISIEQRRAAEDVMRRRDDEVEARMGLNKNAMYYGEELSQFGVDLGKEKVRKYTLGLEEKEAPEMMQEMLQRVEDPHGFDDAEWLTQAGPKEEIKNRFQLFLNRFRRKGSDELIYRERLRNMVINNRDTLEVDMIDLNEGEPTIGYYLPEAPNECLRIMDEATSEYVTKVFFAVYDCCTKDPNPGD